MLILSDSVWAQSDTTRPAISLNGADGTPNLVGLTNPLVGSVFDAGGMGGLSVRFYRNHTGISERWNGNSWVNFDSQDAYWTASVTPSGANSTGGVGGAHNYDIFIRNYKGNFGQTGKVNVLEDVVHPNIPGLRKILYNGCPRFDGSGNLLGYSNDVLQKTVFDSQKIDGNQFMHMIAEATREAKAAGRRRLNPDGTTSRAWLGIATAPNGAKVNFEMIEDGAGKLVTAYPVW